MLLRMLLVVAALAVVAGVPARPIADAAGDLDKFRHFARSEEEFVAFVQLVDPPPGPNPCNVTTQVIYTYM